MSIFIKNIRTYFEKNIWLIDVPKQPFYLRLYYRTLKVIVLSVKGFYEDNCQIRASALTFFSLLSVVPVLALAFAISKGFGIEEILEKSLRENLSGHKEVLTYLLDFSNKMLSTTKGGLIAGIGTVILLFSVMQLISSIESAFNIMWEVKRDRSFMQKFTDYLSIMLFAPVLFVLASSVTVFISTYLQHMMGQYKLLGYATPLISFFIKSFPYVIVWLLFTLIYIIMPNTKVKFTSALIAGIVAGTIYQIIQWGYITFQVGVGRYGAVYGSFAALPLFLIWMQLSWVVILLGGEISYAVQNIKRYRVDQGRIEISFSFKKQLSLLIVHRLIKQFINGQHALTLDEISDDLKIPPRIVKYLINDLVDAKVLAEIRTDIDGVYAYSPALDINKITVNYILEKLEEKGKDEINVENSNEFAFIKDLIKQINLVQRESAGNLLIRDINI